MATATKPRRESSATAERPAEIPPLKIHRLQAENFMRLRALSVQLDGRSVTFAGQNAAGKSSALLAILAGLGQIAGKEIPEPILRGEDKAVVELDLADADTGEVLFCVVSRWTERGRDITVRDPDGNKYGSPQALLDSFLDFICLRPFDWLSHRPQDQVDDVLRICNVRCPVAEVEEITQERHEPREGESAAQYLHRLSADETGLYYVRRRDANRDWKLKVAALEEHRGKLAAVAPMGDDGASLDGLLQERASLERQRSASEQFKATLNDLQADRSAGVAKINQERRDRDAAAKRVTEIEAEIQRLTQAMAEQKQLIANHTAALDSATAMLAEVDADIARAKADVEKVPDPAPRLAELDRQIQDRNRRRKELAEREVLVGLVEKLNIEADDLASLHSQADIRLTKIRDLRRNLLNGVNLGVEGLQIGDGELRFRDVAFKQASRAQQIIVAVALDMRRNPKARFYTLDNAEQLDDESMAVLTGLNQKHDLQAIMAKVQSGTDLSVQLATDF